MESTKYFSRSWKLITRDKGWIKPILVMAAVALVPIAGYLGNLGYALEYARLTAWGVDASPKQKNVNVSGCIKSGARGFVVELGLGLIYAIPVFVASLIVALMPDLVNMYLGGLVRLAISIVSLFVSVIFSIAQLRTAIYESIGAGFSLSGLSELIKRDTGGFVKLFLMQLLCAVFIWILTFVLILALMVPFVIFVASSAAAGSGEMSSRTAVYAVLQSLVFLLPMLALVGYGISLLSTFTRLLMLNAVGLWMRQFDVPSWRRSDEPLPPVDPNAEQNQGYTAPPLPPATSTSRRPQATPPQDPSERLAHDAAFEVETIPLARKPKFEQTDESRGDNEPASVEEATNELHSAPMPRTQPIPKPAAEPQPAEPSAEESPVEEKPVAAASSSTEDAVEEHVEVERIPLTEEDDKDDDVSVEDLYNDLSDAIKENDHVHEDDDQ